MLIGVDWLTEWLRDRCGHLPEGTDGPETAGLYADVLTRAGLETVVISPDGVDGVPILECVPTPNRGDCLSALGVARELALSLGIGALSMPSHAPVASATKQKPGIRISAPEQCPFYAARLITGVDATAVAPDWLRRRLRQAGMESVNGIVDVGNFVMLELGQPMHAFDYDRIKKGRIRVRLAARGESLRLLNGRTISLEDDCLLITSGRRPIALAGIMGGHDSAVGPATGNIMLESAVFMPAAVLGRPMRYDLHTESSHRFERGVDSAMSLAAMERATALILEIGGGSPGPVVSRWQRRYLSPPPVIHLRLSHLNDWLGLDMTGDEVEKILTDLQTRPGKTRLGFRLRAPSWRPDIRTVVDVAEEVVRLYGCDRVPEAPASVPLTTAPVSGTFRLSENLCDSLVARDYREVCTPSFISESMPATLGLREEGLPLDNPMSASQAVLRPSIWPGLIQVLRYNLNRQQSRVRIFESGPVFRPDGESTELAGVAYGDRHVARWDRVTGPVGFHDVKQDICALLQLCQGAPAFQRQRHESLHPGRSVSIRLEERNVGWLGELHPRISTEMGLPMSPILFSLSVEVLEMRRPAVYKPYSDLPRVRRDLALIVPRLTEADDLLRCVRDCCQRLYESGSGMQLENVRLFDVFMAPGIGEDNKSVAMSLIFQKFSSMIQDTEVDQWMDSVVISLKEELSASLRKK